MKYAYLTDTGIKREVNEDNVCVFTVGNIFTVALLLDGMGGMNGGKIASQTAMQVMQSELELGLMLLLTDMDNLNRNVVKEIMKRAALCANEVVYRKSQSNASLSGMGTTLVAAVFYGRNCCILNVGPRDEA